MNNFSALLCFLLLCMGTELNLALKFVTNNWEFDAPVLVCFAELIKLFVAGALAMQDGSLAQALSPRSFEVMTFLKFSIPAAIYTIVNISSILAFAQLPAGKVSALMQLKLPMTAVFSRILLSTRFTVHQFLALALIVCGSMMLDLNHWTDQADGEERGEPPTWGYVFVAANVAGAAAAGVFTQLLFQEQLAVSIHVQNVQLYFWGVLSNGFLYFMNPTKNFSQNLNLGLVFASVSLVGLGYTVAYVVKFVDSVAKSVVLVTSVVPTAVLAMLLFNEPITPDYALGSLTIMMAASLYAMLPKADQHTLSDGRTKV